MHKNRKKKTLETKDRGGLGRVVNGLQPSSKSTDISMLSVKKETVKTSSQNNQENKNTPKKTRKENEHESQCRN